MISGMSPLIEKVENFPASGSRLMLLQEQVARTADDRLIIEVEPSATGAVRLLEQELCVSLSGRDSITVADAQQIIRWSRTRQRLPQRQSRVRFSCVSIGQESVSSRASMTSVSSTHPLEDYHPEFKKIIDAAEEASRQKRGDFEKVVEKYFLRMDMARKLEFRTYLKETLHLDDRACFLPNLWKRMIPVMFQEELTIYFSQFTHDEAESLRHFIQSASPTRIADYLNSIASQGLIHAIPSRKSEKNRELSRVAEFIKNNWQEVENLRYVQRKFNQYQLEAKIRARFCQMARDRKSDAVISKAMKKQMKSKSIDSFFKQAGARELAGNTGAHNHLRAAIRRQRFEIFAPPGTARALAYDQPLPRWP